MNYLKLDRVRLIITERCNLHCGYCYETKKRSINTINISATKKQLRKLSNNSSVLFFGGEPFLQIDLMKELIEWGYEYKNFKFSITTNGQIIDREFFRNYCKNIRVLVSIDGPEHVHDLNRGKGSWKKAMEFHEIFREETKDETNKQINIINPVYDKRTIQHMFETIKWISTKISTGDLFVANTHQLSEQDIEEFERQMELIKNWYINEKIYETRFSIYPFKIAENLINKNKIYQNNTNSCNECVTNSCDEYHNREINVNGKLVACGRQLWEYRNNNKMKLYHRDQEDYDGVDYCVVNRNDIPECRNCEVYGCKICPAEWNINQNKLYVPNIQFCRIWKIVIKKTHEYLKERKLC